jgi:hypothetical protein
MIALPLIQSSDQLLTNTRMVENWLESYWEVT